MRLTPEVISCANFRENTLGRMRRFEQRKQEKLDRLAREKRESDEREIRQAVRRVAKDEEEKESVMMSAVNRLDHMIRKKEEKLERERLESLKAQRERDLEGCTFQPKTSSRSSSMKRGLDDLLSWKSNLLKRNLVKQLEEAQTNLNRSSRAHARGSEAGKISVAETVDRLYKEAFAKKSLGQAGEESLRTRSRRSSLHNVSRRNSVQIADHCRRKTGNLNSSHHLQNSNHLSLNESQGLQAPVKYLVSPQKPTARENHQIKDSTLPLSSKEADYFSREEQSIGRLLDLEEPTDKPDPSRRKDQQPSAAQGRQPGPSNTEQAHHENEQFNSHPTHPRKAPKQIKFKKASKDPKPATTARQASPPPKQPASSRRETSKNAFVEEPTEETLAQIPLRRLQPAQGKTKSPLFKEGDTRTTKCSNEQDHKKSGLLGSLDKLIDSSIKKENQGKSQLSKHLQTSKHEASGEGTNNSSLLHRDSKSPEKEDSSGIKEIGIRDFIKNLDHDPQRELAKRRSESKSRANHTKLQERIETIFNRDRSPAQTRRAARTPEEGADDSMARKMHEEPLE